MKAVCLIGSPRENGNTAAIAAAVLRTLDECGWRTTTVRLSECNIGYCNGCKACYQTGECVQDDDVRKIAAEMLAADLVIVASPSYWGDVTAQMKTFIDRCTPYCNQNGAKLPVSVSAKGAAIAVRAGRNRQENLTLVHTVEHFLGHLEIPLIASFTVEGVDTPDDLQSQPSILKNAAAFGAELASVIK